MRFLLSDKIREVQPEDSFMMKLRKKIENRQLANYSTWDYETIIFNIYVPNDENLKKQIL